MSIWGWTWLAWLVVSVAWFVGLELTALVTSGPRSTLSAWLRRWLGIEPEKPWRAAGISLFVGFLVWLGLHIGLGILPG